MEAVNILSIITIAFLGSFGHCMGMCGGIVLAGLSLSGKIKFLTLLEHSFASNSSL